MTLGHITSSLGPDGSVTVLVVPATRAPRYWDVAVVRFAVLS